MAVVESHVLRKRVKKCVEFFQVNLYELIVCKRAIVIVLPILGEPPRYVSKVDKGKNLTVVSIETVCIANHLAFEVRKVHILRFDFLEILQNLRLKLIALFE